mmetsp:Transcript_33188/g.45502  ORF Transcript_33188/g.45502 Transcript_33188/m.45502 type:complete len:346 (-) Transcript_33188:107-1144(-)
MRRLILVFLLLQRALSWKRYSDAFPNDAQDMQPVTLNQTLEAIYREPHLSIKPEYVGPNFKVISDKELHFKCENLMREVIESDKRAKSPCIITPELQKKFTLDGLIEGGLDCTPKDYEQIQNGVSGNWTWNYNLIENYDGSIEQCGAYGNSACIETCDRYGPEFIKDKVGMVLGTQHPWLEKGLIHFGAKHITTIEYMKIISEHPKLSTMHPVEMAKKFLDKTLPPVDFIFTYSSLEHDGLGRYGDPINPYADLESMARAHCLLKPNGVFFLGIPLGPDHLAGFDHRIYGKHRLSLILPLWEPIDLVNAYLNLSDTKSHVGLYQHQPVLVLKKKSKHHHNSNRRR